MKNLLLILLLVSCTLTFSQKGMGYYGKRNFFTISFSPSFVTYNYMRNTSTEGKFKFGPTVMNFKYSMGYDFAITRKQTLGIEYTFDPQRITLHGIELNQNSGDTDIDYIMGDPVFKVHSIQLNHRIYLKQNIVGIGFHITSSVGVYFASVGTVEYTSELRSVGNQDLFDRVPTSSENGTHYYLKTGEVDYDGMEEFKSKAVSLGIQFGWDIPINRFLIASFALGSTGFIGFNNYDSKIGPGFDSADFWTKRDRYSQSTSLYVNYEYRLKQSFRLKNVLTFEIGFKFAL